MGYAWRRQAHESSVAVPKDGRNAEAWTSKAKFAVVLEAASRSGLHFSGQIGTMVSL